MSMDYKTCGRTIIYLNEVKLAKTTLSELISRTSSPRVEKMAEQRLQLLKQFEAELLSFLIDRENDLPFNLSERCRAIVFWFASQKVSEGGDIDHIKKKLELGDSIMRSECIHILVEPAIPEILKNLLNDHLWRVASLE